MSAPDPTRARALELARETLARQGVPVKPALWRKVEAATLEWSGPHRLAGLAETLHNRLALAHEGLNFRIERAGEGELPRFELKAKRTVDRRDAPIGAVG